MQQRNLLRTGSVLCAAVLAGGLGLGLAPAALAAPAAADGPKNIIVMIGDGMGYNHVDIANLYETGTSNHQVSVDPATGNVTQEPSTPTQVFEKFPVQISMEHNSANSPVYDPKAAWGAFDWVKSGATDSAAAGTALATGVKTNNGIIGLDSEGGGLTNLVEHANEAGKSTGVVSSVPFSHATPSAYIAHNTNRNNLVGIAKEMIESDADVIMGAGHPEFNDSNAARAAKYEYIGKPEYEALKSGATDFKYVEEDSAFEALASGSNLPDKVFGLAQVGSTLQQGRAGNSEGKLPWEVAKNDVVDLDTMTTGALNVLGQNKEGFFVMVEGGAIDWTGHANQTTRTIEEQQDFNSSVEAASAWVEKNSNWDETLLIVTADHETGYLAGNGASPADGWTPMTGAAGEVPEVSWHSGNHTNALVPFYAKGAGSESFKNRATKHDPVRGAYLDNTDVAEATFDMIDVTAQGGEGTIPLKAEVPVARAGELKMSIADFGGHVGFSAPASTQSGLKLTAKLPSVAVTDSRNDAQAQAGGWSVAGQSTDLAAGNRVLGAEYLGWDPLIVDSRPGVKPGKGVASTVRDGSGLGASATLGRAGNDARVGTAVLGADLNLEVPAETEAGRYNGAVSLTLFPVD